MASKIDDYMEKGIDKRSIVKLLGVTPETIYAWPKVRRPGLVNEENPVAI